MNFNKKTRTPYIHILCLDHISMTWRDEWYKGPPITGEPDPMMLEGINPIIGDHRTIFKTAFYDADECYVTYLTTVTYDQSPFYQLLGKHGFVLVKWWNRELKSWETSEPIPKEVAR